MVQDGDQGILGAVFCSLEDLIPAQSLKITQVPAEKVQCCAQQKLTQVCNGSLLHRAACAQVGDP
jgi:hypothetical protein